DRRVRQLRHLPRVVHPDAVHLGGDRDRVVVRERRGGEPLVEAGCVVALATADAEVRGGRAGPLRSSRSHDRTLPGGGDAEQPRAARVFDRDGPRGGTRRQAGGSPSGTSTWSAASSAGIGASRSWTT